VGGGWKIVYRKIMKSKRTEKTKRSSRALLLFSGGLDSILAAKILEEQGIGVTALTFVSFFFKAEEAEKSARENKIKILTRDISSEHFAMVKKPRFGRGAGMNPCIDCHLLMLIEAKKIMKEGKYDFLATGEVLGQRPMSQNRKALELIEKKAGMKGKILRPLSAQVLPETEMEKSGMVDREKLPAISGRSRKEQLMLAKKYKIKYFPTPAGGCILTDKEYSKKLGDLIEKIKTIKKSDLQLLRLGRHFWMENTRIILGRNHEENLALKKMAEKGDILIDPKNIPGPTSLVRGKRSEKVIDCVKKLLQKYSKKAEEDFEVVITEL
jgi:tRNA-uridine 2-sulfurtransferase